MLGTPLVGFSEERWSLNVMLAWSDFDARSYVAPNGTTSS